MREPPNWYDDNADNPPWIKALAEVRRLARREGWRYQHVQAIIVANRIGLESLSIRSGTEESWRSA